MPAAAKKKTPAKPRKPRSQVVVLGSSMMIADVAALFEKFTGCLEKQRPLTLDGSKVEKIDTAGLQLLTLLALEGPGRGVEIRWRKPSPVLLEAATKVDLAGHIGLVEKSKD